MPIRGFKKTNHSFSFSQFVYIQQESNIRTHCDRSTVVVVPPFSHVGRRSNERSTRSFFFSLFFQKSLFLNSFFKPIVRWSPPQHSQSENTLNSFAMMCVPVIIEFYFIFSSSFSSSSPSIFLSLHARDLKQALVFKCSSSVRCTHVCECNADIEKKDVFNIYIYIYIYMYLPVCDLFIFSSFSFYLFSPSLI